MAKAEKRVRVEKGLYRRGRTFYACATPPGSRRPSWKSLGEVGIMAARRGRDQWAAEVRSGGVVLLTADATYDEVADDALAEIADRVSRGDLSRRTAEAYGSSERNHVRPYFTGRAIGSIDSDEIAAWVVEQEADDDIAAWSVRAHWTALRMVFTHAARRKWIAASPADVLKTHERPGPGRSRQRFLNDGEIAALLAHAPTLQLRVAIGLMTFCGLRVSEALGLVWREIDFGRGFVLARFQMSREGERVPIKTDRHSDAGQRDIALMDALAHMLKELRLASRFSGPEDLVLAGPVGKTIGYWDLRAAFAAARDAAGLSDDVTPHACRHTFASILIDQGRPVEYVSQQLGHSQTSTTLDVYVHLFRRKQHADAARDGLNAGYGSLLRSS